MRSSISLPMRLSFLFSDGCKPVFLALVSLCFCLSFRAVGQESNPVKPASNPPEQTAAKAAVQPPDLSKEALVWEKMQTRIREEADGTGSRETTARVRILADAGVKQMAILTFTYTALNQQVEIGYVRVIKPDGTVVVTPDYNVQDLPADVTRTAPMYSDVHQKHVAVKGLGVGDTLEYQTTLRTLKPEVQGHFWLEYSFEKDSIIFDEQLDLDLPASKAVTVASADLQPTITTAKDRMLYHWASSNPTRPDPDAPPKSTKHWKPSVQVTTFASWEQVGAWYASLQRNALTVTPAIQAKADALTKGLTKDEDKVRAIFNDVALHIHYVGLEFGIGRYQPHPADDVLSNEYGDCKDKHTLLAALLKAEGIEAWPVLINSSGRELDAATPSPGQFNHVITLVSLDGKLRWMDSTEEVAPVDLLFAVLRDKQALAIPSNKQAYLERTPDNGPSPRSVRLQVEGKLTSEGVFTGHIAQSADGDIGMLYRMGFRQVPQSQWKELVERVSQAQGYAGEVSNPQVSEVEQISQPFSFSFDYTREKYYQWDDKVTSHWISPPLPAIGGELAPGVKEKKPADEPELGSKGETVYHAVLELPKGWTMTVPQNVDLKEDWFEYHAAYSFKNGVYTADRIARVKMHNVPLGDWEKFLTMRRAMYEDWNRQTLISPPGLGTKFDAQNMISGGSIGYLEGKFQGISKAIVISPEMMEQMVAMMRPLRDAAAIFGSDTPPSANDLAKATDIVSKCMEAIEAKTLTLPSDDPQSLNWAIPLSYAWAERGWAALEAKDLSTAESYLRAAWKLSHDQISGYLLGVLLEAKGNKTAAAHQYELAHVSSSNYLDNIIYASFNVQNRINDSYQKLTGNPMTATSLDHGRYNGSLLAELDKETIFKSFIPASKHTGDVYFSVVYEAGKPVKAYLLDGDKKFAPIGATLEARKLGGVLPTGSKARLLREVRLTCSEYGGGCDAYLLAPSAIRLPPKVVPTPNGIKTVQIEVKPLEVQHQ
jgi:hypothetical protein